MEKAFRTRQTKERNKKDSLMNNKITFIKSIYYFNHLIIFLKLIITIHMFVEVLARENNQFEQKDSHSSYITLNINKKGYQKF